MKSWKPECTWQQSDRKLSLANTEGFMLHSATTKSPRPRINRTCGLRVQRQSPKTKMFLLIKEMVTKRMIFSLVDLQSVWHKISILIPQNEASPQVLFLKLFHILSYWNQLTSWSHYAIRQIHAQSAQSIFYFQAFSIRLVECVDRSWLCSSPAWTESTLSPESSSLLLLTISLLTGLCSELNGLTCVKVPWSYLTWYSLVRVLLDLSLAVILLLVNDLKPFSN